MTLDAPTASAGAKSDLTEAERVAFREQGYFVREAIFSEADLVKLRDGAEDIHRKIVAEATSAEIERMEGARFQDVLGSRVKWEWKENSGEIRSMEPVGHLSPAIDAIIDDERLCSPIRGLLDVPALSLFTDKLNFKRPGGSPFPWHQDAPYWAFECKHLDQLISVQVYLDDATEENGCLWMVPGSHLQGHVPHPPERGEGALARLYSDVRRLDGKPLVPMIAPAGSAIFFNSWVVHGSKGNRTDASRRAFIFTYQPEGLPMRDTDVVRVPRRQRVSAQGFVQKLKGLVERAR